MCVYPGSNASSVEVSCSILTRSCFVCRLHSLHPQLRSSTSAITMFHSPTSSMAEFDLMSPASRTSTGELDSPPLLIRKRSFAFAASWASSLDIPILDFDEESQWHNGAALNASDAQNIAVIININDKTEQRCSSTTNAMTATSCKKAVRFDPHVTIIQVPNLIDNRDTLWYSAMELKQFRLDHLMRRIKRRLAGTHRECAMTRQILSLLADT